MPRKHKAFSILLLLLLINFSVFASSSAFDDDSLFSTLYVDDDNTQGPWEGTIDDPYQTIQDAIDASFHDDHIIINDGTYQEPLLITHPLHLKGINTTQTIILHTEDTVALTIQDTNNVTIESLTIRCDTPEKTDIVLLSDSDYCTLQELEIISITTQYHAINVRGAYNAIYDNIFTGYRFYYGIGLSSSNGTLIHNNSIQDCITGVYLLRSHQNIIEYNMISDCVSGITLEEANNNQVEHNGLFSNEKGMFCTYATQNNIRYNDFHSNYENAKFAKYCHKGFLKPNRWSDNCWDDNFFIVRPIFGLMYIPTTNPIGIFIPWYEVDWHARHISQ